MYYYRFIFNIAFILIACALAIVAFRRMDRAARYLAVLVWVALLSELAGHVSVLAMGSNSLVYMLYGFIELMLIGLFFNAALDTLRTYRVGILLGVIGLVFGVLGFLRGAGIDQLNVDFILLECVIVNLLALYFFYCYLFRQEEIRGDAIRLFALVCLLMFSNLIAFIHYAMYDYISVLFRDQGISLQVTVAVINALVYVGFSLVFYRYVRTPLPKAELK